MNDEYRIAAYQLRYDLQQASEDSVAARGLLEEVIDPMFDDYRCDGILEAYAKKNGGDLNKAARAWMEENYNALYVQLQDLRVRMKLYTIHCVPSINCGGVIRADLLDLRQHGLIGFAALLLIFSAAFVRMDS